MTHLSPAFRLFTRRFEHALRNAAMAKGADEKHVRRIMDALLMDSDPEFLGRCNDLADERLREIVSNRLDVLLQASRQIV